jgi:hypothetical protein
MDLGNEGGAAGALGGGDGGQGGGGTGAGAGGDGGGQGGQGGQGGDGGQGGQGGDGGAADLAWLENFSAEGGDANNPSPRDWVKSKGFKSLDDLASSYREAEKAIRNGGRLEVPGDDATPEQLAAFHKAIGVPEKPDAYEVAAIEGHELDDGLIGAMRPIAHAAGVPAKAWKQLTDGLMQYQLNQLQEDATRQDAEWKELTDSWGTAKAEKTVEYQRGVEAAGVKREEVAQLQKIMGSKRVGELFQRIGAGIAEDSLIGGGKGKFGVTGAEAQAEIDRLIKDEEFGKQLQAKDPQAVARWDRLNAAVAAARDAAAKAAA